MTTDTPSTEEVLAAIVTARDALTTLADRLTGADEKDGTADKFANDTDTSRTPGKKAPTLTADEIVNSIGGNR